MLNNKKFNIVLALIIAIGLWAYVIGEINPTDTKTFRDIPIQMLNQQTLEENSLAVLSASAESMSITLTGSRSDINRIEAKEIIASVDLSEVTIGENDLKINIKVPENVELDDKSHNKITLTVEAKISKEVDVVPEYRGTFDAEQEPITVDLSQDKVTVTGAESLVKRVDHASAIIGAEQISEQMKTVSCNLVPVDKKGTGVSRVALSAKTVQVTSELVSVKTVALKVPVSNETEGVAERTYSVPKTITIKGKSSILSQIDSITAEVVDISQVMKNSSVPILPILPEGVQVSSKSAENLFVSVLVVPLEEKSFHFDVKDIQSVGIEEGLQAQFHWTGKIEVTVRSRAEDLAAIEAGDIQLSVDLEGMKAGGYQVPLKASCKKEHLDLLVMPEEIRVTLE